MIEQLYKQYLDTLQVTTDSRKITPGCIFFALKGTTFDGNTFAPQALEQGAALCVISDPQYRVDERCIVVPDVLEILQQLARHHRSHLQIPVVGITGTNGKTTTKELVHAVLSRRYRTHATQGNFNNHLGVPLTILSTPRDCELLIVEMGANHPGEIEFLCNIAQPTCGLITTVGKAHLEGFGSFEGVVQTKTELYRHLAASPLHDVLFVNTDNDILMEQAERLSMIPEIPTMIPGYYPHTNLPDWQNNTGLAMMTYGSRRDAQVKGSLVGSNPYMKFYFEDDDNVYSVQTHLVGDYNFANAMAAVCVGRFFGVELFDIKQALEDYIPSNNRSQYKTTTNNRLLLDCYNANPSSMGVALEGFESMDKPRKMVILGDMKELGADSEREHQKLIEQLEQSSFDPIFLVGTNFQDILPYNNSRFHWFATADDAKNYLKRHPIIDYTILLKGSNSNKLWTLEELL